MGQVRLDVVVWPFARASFVVFYTDAFVVPLGPIKLVPACLSIDAGCLADRSVGTTECLAARDNRMPRHTMWLQRITIIIFRRKTLHDRQVEKAGPSQQDPTERGSIVLYCILFY